MKARVIFHLKPGSFKGWLMKTFTGCHAYHCGFLVGEDTVFDMHFMRRKVTWASVLKSHPDTIFEIWETPVEVPLNFLIQKKLDDLTIYGFQDYLIYAFRWAYHLVGKSTPNHDGLICSEMVYEDLKSCGWKYDQFMEVPSPCCLRESFQNIGLDHEVVYGANVSEEAYRP